MTDAANTDILAELEQIVGPANVAQGAAAAAWTRDWTGAYSWTPLAVARPAATPEVARIVRLANQTGTPLVPVGGNTGLSGGSAGEGAIMVSLDRMTAVREIRPEARIAVVEAGVILSRLHDAAEEADLIFPLTFGARGSAMIGGCLSTNAGGSNVLRYGNARDLCLGLEAVLPTGEVLDLMSALHKDNSGYDLRDLLIGAEGTLGIITAAVLKLHPRPRAHATAMVAAPSLDAALGLLNRLQAETGGAVEAFEYMPGAYLDAYARKFPDSRPPFADRHEVNILVEVGALSARDAHPAPDGSLPVVNHLETVLADLLETGAVLDAVVARTEAQRSEMWARREAAAEVALTRKPMVNNDISVPLDKVQTFLETMARRLREIEPGARDMTVAHLGDGNIHYTVWPATDAPAVHDAIMEAVEDVALHLGGSFSAEHGIGISKKPSMARRKDAVALQTMRAVKQAIDPAGIMNPAKVLPGV